MKRIGLVGGVASGKSLVARQLCELGAGLLDADKAGHEVLRIPQVIDAVRNRFGAGVLKDDGQVDRAAVGRIVFAPGEEGRRERKYLERLTHPHIGRLLARQEEELAARGGAAVVLDVPLLLESGWGDSCDKIVYVETPYEVRLGRAKERGWSDADFAAREAAQESLDAKRRRADVVIDNSGSAESTHEQVVRFWRTLAS
jgi:dephospho-CoA kinase